MKQPHLHLCQKILLVFEMELELVHMDLLNIHPLLELYMQLLVVLSWELGLAHPFQGKSLLESQHPC